MVRKLMMGLVVVGLVAFIGACSDDDVPKPDAYVADAGPDMPVVDAKAESPVADKGVDGDMTVKPDADAAVTKKYSVLVGIAEYVGKAGITPDAGMIRVARPLANVETADAVIKPDFIDLPQPPNCVGYKWDKGQLPNRSAWDAGKLTITGHDKTALYVDGSNPGAPAPLPDPIECTRKLTTGSTTLYEYDCGLPLKTVLPVKSMFSSTTKLDISSTGGTDVPAFSKTGITPGAVPVLTTDLTKIDPSTTVKIAWNSTVNAALVAIVMRAQLMDGSKFAEITCSAVALVGDKTIPAGALALLPAGSTTNPLRIDTFVAGLNVDGATTTWGGYKVGGGQGVFGTTILTK